MKAYFAVIVLFLLVACHREADEPTPNEVPACIQLIIGQNGRGTTNDNYLAIYRYKYQKRYVYFGEADCCDQYNLLFDNNCQVLCAPNGGFTGGGDGKCPDFFKEATEETELWRRSQ